LFCFLDDMVEKGQTEIGFQDIDAMALRHLVDFSYTGEIMITEENVQVRN
jgi:BTB/POZ domain.